MSATIRVVRGRVYRDREGNLWRGSNRNTMYRILATGDRISGAEAWRAHIAEKAFGPMTSADAETEALSRGRVTRSADPSPTRAESVPDLAGSTGTGNQKDGGQ